MHTNCRNGYYPQTNNTIQRQNVPDDFVLWKVKWLDYNPVSYTARHIGGQIWADPDITDSEFHPKWNSIDNHINRKSYTGNYNVVDNYPMNPVGRTGLRGRGLLGRWGPNHAADSIVTKWKRNPYNNSKIVGSTGKSIMQFVAIKRRDTGEWAIPGGMVDPGESPTETLKREFSEEALNFLEKEYVDKEKFSKQIDDTFSTGKEVYKGYVDDRRNTDNAWIETVAVHFHDEDGTSIGSVPLSAGDDAVGVCWTDIDHNLNLYASHIMFFEEIVKRFVAHW